eukprot:PhF_6_TR44481/c0_g1_i2/m.68492
MWHRLAVLVILSCTCTPSAVLLTPYNTSLSFDPATSTNMLNSTYHKIPLLENISIQYSLFVLQIGTVSNVMRGVRAYVVGYPITEVQPRCAFLDMDIDVKKNVTIKNMVKNRLYFRLKYGNKLDDADAYFDMLYRWVKNLTLYVNADRYCSKRYTHFEVHWNLEKTFSTFSRRHGWYMTLVDFNNTYDDWLLESERSSSNEIEGGTSWYYSRFAYLPNALDMAEIYDVDSYTPDDDTWPYGWVCGRGLGNGTWIWECGDVKG